MREYVHGSPLVPGPQARHEEFDSLKLGCDKIPEALRMLRSGTISGEHVGVRAKVGPTNKTGNANTCAQPVKQFGHSFGMGSAYRVDTKTGATKQLDRKPILDNKTPADCTEQNRLLRVRGVVRHSP